MARIRQTSFAGGELAPSLWGRTDLALRQNAFRRGLNWLVSRQGAAMTRPGTVYVGEVKNSSHAVRLIPFVFSDDVSYCLEFGEHYVRFITDGAYVLWVDPGYPDWDEFDTYAAEDVVVWRNPDEFEGGVYVALGSSSGSSPPGDPTSWQLLYTIGEPYEVVTPYLHGDVLSLKYAQSGNLLTLCCPGYPPAELMRNGDTDWTFTNISFDRPTLTAHPFVSGAYITQFALPTADATHPAREWTWMVTQMVKQPDGSFIESAPVKVAFNEAGGTFTAMPETVAVYPDMPVTVQMYPSGSLTGEILYHRVYRGRGDLFGMVGATDSWSFTDVGDEPDYARQPPKGLNPFKVYSYEVDPPTLTRTEYPRCVAYFEDRRVFAATVERPAFLWLSAVGDYANFDYHALALASDAAEYALASRKWEEIRGLVGLERLIIPTSSAVWSFTGPGGGAVDPSNDTPPDVRAHVQIGASNVDPLVVGNTVLMVRTKGSGVRDVFYDLQQQSFSGGDVSQHARHLFEGHAISDWAYQEDPFGIVWAVRDDGKLLTFTYERESNQAAWTLHRSGFDSGKDGAFEAVCCVPEGTEDAVYVAVTRELDGVMHRYVERFASRLETDQRRVTAVDCALTYSGTELTTLAGLAHLEGRSVMVLADGEVTGPYTVTAGEIDISEDCPDGVAAAVVGLPYTCDLELLELAEERTRRKNVSALFFEVVDSRGLKVGEDEDSLVEWRQRTVADSYDAISAATALVEVKLKSSWNTGGRAMLRQDQPLFTTVVGVTRKVDFGDD